MDNGRFLDWNTGEFRYTIEGVVYHCVTRRRGIDVSEPSVEKIVTRLVGISILGVEASMVKCTRAIHEGDKVSAYKEQEKAIQTLHKCIRVYTKSSESNPITSELYSTLGAAKSKATEVLVASLHGIMRVGDNTAISSLYSLTKLKYKDELPPDMYNHMVTPWKDSSKLGRTTLPPNVKTHIYVKAVSYLFMALYENYDLLEHKIKAVISERYKEIQPVSASVKRFHNSVLGAVSLNDRELSKTLQLFHVSKEGIEEALYKLIVVSAEVQPKVTKEIVVAEQTDEKMVDFKRAMSTVIKSLDPSDETQAGLYRDKGDLFIHDMHHVVNTFLTNEHISEADAWRRIESVSLLGSKDKKPLLLIELNHGLRTDNRTYPFMSSVEVTGRSQFGKINGAVLNTLLTAILSPEADKYVSGLDITNTTDTTVTTFTPALPVSTTVTSTPRKVKRGVLLGENTVKILQGKMHEKVYNLVHSKIPIVTLEKGTVYTIHEAEGALS